MNRCQTQTHQPIRNAAYREAFARLEAALEQNTALSHTEKLQLLGRQMFGDLWNEPETKREGNAQHENSGGQPEARECTKGKITDGP